MTNTDLREKATELAKRYTPVVDWNRANPTARARLVDPIEAALVSAYNAGVEAAAVESEKALDAIVGGGPIYTGGGPRAIKLPGAP